MKRSDISTGLVIECCLIAKENNDSGKKLIAPWEVIQQKTYAPEKVIYAAMERDLDRGYLECGVSIRTAWATDKGIEYLNNKKVLASA